MPAPMQMSISQTQDLLQFAQEAFNLLSSVSQALGSCPRIDVVLALPGAEPMIIQRMTDLLDKGLAEAKDLFSRIPSTPLSLIAP